MFYSRIEIVLEGKQDVLSFGVCGYGPYLWTPLGYVTDVASFVFSPSLSSALERPSVLSVLHKCPTIELCPLPTFAFDMCVCACVYVYTSCSSHMKVGWQPSGVSSLHPPHGSWDLTLVARLWDEHLYLLSYLASLSVVCVSGSSCGSSISSLSGCPDRRLEGLQGVQNGWAQRVHWEWVQGGGASPRVSVLKTKTFSDDLRWNSSQRWP